MIHTKGNVWVQLLRSKFMPNISTHNPWDQNFIPKHGSYLSLSLNWIWCRRNALINPFLNTTLGWRSDTISSYGKSKQKKKKLLIAPTEVLQSLQILSGIIQENKNTEEYLMAIMARQATCSANSRISLWGAGQAWEDCLPLHITFGISALFAIITTQNQIRFL